MSACISYNGEFSEHQYAGNVDTPIEQRYVCGRCLALDDDAMLTEIERLEGDLAVAVHEATTARRLLRIARAAHAVDHDLLAAASAALVEIAAPVQPEETQQHG